MNISTQAELGVWSHCPQTSHTVPRPPKRAHPHAGEGPLKRALSDEGEVWRSRAKVGRLSSVRLVGLVMLLYRMRMSLHFTATIARLYYMRNFNVWFSCEANVGG